MDLRESDAYKIKGRRLNILIIQDTEEAVGLNILKTII